MFTVGVPFRMRCASLSFGTILLSLSFTVLNMVAINHVEVRERRRRVNRAGAMKEKDRERGEGEGGGGGIDRGRTG